jgi:hypothetical protein
MLNIHNGDSTATTAHQGAIPGAHFAFREALIGGPAPANLSEPEWRKLRAAHLSAAYGGSWEEAERDLERQHAALASFYLHDEVVLWFEHDLFCQLNLIYVLDWFASRDLGKTKLSLICIDNFPDKQNFHGLGELNATELASLFDTRHEVTTRELETASSAWAAYRSPQPTDLETFLQDDTSAMPFLAPALHSHLARFPSTTNGLGRIEQRGLALVNDGLKRFTELFPRFVQEEPVYGLGDFQLYLALRQLSCARTPLLRGGHGPKAEMDSTTIKQSAFEITDKGKAVLDGDSDFVHLNGIDMWLGGVHLTNKNFWRWDVEQEKILAAEI